MRQGRIPSREANLVNVVHVSDPFGFGRHRKGQSVKPGVERGGEVSPLRIPRIEVGELDRENCRLQTLQPGVGSDRVVNELPVRAVVAIPAAQGGNDASMVCPRECTTGARSIK